MRILLAALGVLILTGALYLMPEFPRWPQAKEPPTKLTQEQFETIRKSYERDLNLKEKLLHDQVQLGLMTSREAQVSYTRSLEAARRDLRIMHPTTHGALGEP